MTAENRQSDESYDEEFWAEEDGDAESVIGTVPDDADEPDDVDIPVDADEPDDADETDDADEPSDAGPEEAAEASADNSGKMAKKLARTEKGLKNAQWFLIYLIIFLAVAWIMFFKIIGITHMPSEDMEPRVDAGDLLVFYRLDRDAEFEDVIIFEKDIDGNGEKTLFVGRVMAAPGDTVEINDNNRLVVNGNLIVETSIYYAATPKRGDRVTYPLTLQEGQYFVLVDNREQGTDSRYFGPVSRDEVLGTVITLLRRNKL